MAFSKISRSLLVAACCAFMAMLTGGCYRDDEETGSAQAGQQNVTKCTGKFCAPDPCGADYFKLSDEVDQLKAELAESQARLACKTGVGRHDCAAPGQKIGLPQETPGLARKIQQKSAQLHDLEKAYRECCAERGGDPNLGFEGDARGVVISVHGIPSKPPIKYVPRTSVEFRVTQLLVLGCYHDTLRLKLEDNELSTQGADISFQEIEAGGSMNVREGWQSTGGVELFFSARVLVNFLGTPAGEDNIHFQVSNEFGPPEEWLFGEKDPLTTTLTLVDEISGEDGQAFAYYGLHTLELEAQIEGISDPRLK